MSGSEQKLPSNEVPGAGGKSPETVSLTPTVTGVAAEEAVGLNPGEMPTSNPNSSGSADSSSINDVKASPPAEEKAKITEQEYKLVIERIHRAYDTSERSGKAVVYSAQLSSDVDKALSFLEAYADTTNKEANLKLVYSVLRLPSRLDTSPDRKHLIILLDRMAQLGSTQAQARLAHYYATQLSATRALHYAAMLTRESYATLRTSQRHDDINIATSFLELTSLIKKFTQQPDLKLQGQLVTVLETLGLAEEKPFKLFILETKSKTKASTNDYSAEDKYTDGAALFQSGSEAQKRYGLALLIEAAKDGYPAAHNQVVDYLVGNYSKRWPLEEALACAELLTQDDVEKFAPKALDAKQAEASANPTKSVEEVLKKILDSSPTETGLSRLNAIYTRLAISPPLYLSYHLMPKADKDQQSPEEKFTTAMQLIKKGGAGNTPGFTLLQQAAATGHVEAMYQASLRGFRPSPSGTDDKGKTRPGVQFSVFALNDYLKQAADAGHLLAQVDLISYWVKRPDESQALSYAAKITLSQYESLREEKQKALKTALTALSKSDNLTFASLSSLINVIETLGIKEDIPFFDCLVCERDFTLSIPESKETENKENLLPYDKVSMLLGSGINRHQLLAFTLCKQMDLSALTTDQLDFLYGNAMSFVSNKRDELNSAPLGSFLKKIAGLGCLKAQYELLTSSYKHREWHDNSFRICVDPSEALGYAEGISKEQYEVFSEPEKRNIRSALQTINISIDPSELESKSRLLSVFTKFEMALPDDLQPRAAVKQSVSLGAAVTAADDDEKAPASTQEKIPLLDKAAPTKAKNWPLIALSLLLLVPALGAIVLSIGALATSAAAFGVGPLVISATIAPYTLAAGLVLGLLCAIALLALLVSRDAPKSLPNTAALTQSNFESSTRLSGTKNPLATPAAKQGVSAKNNPQPAAATRGGNKNAG